MTPARAILLVLIAIALVFAAGVHRSMTAKDDPHPSGDPPPWTRALGNLLSVDGPPGAKVSAAKVKADPASAKQGLASIVLAANQGCTLSVGPDKSDFRSLQLKVTAGSVRVTAEIDGEDEDETYAAGKSTSVPIPKEGRSVRLDAVGAGGASVAIE